MWHKKTSDAVLEAVIIIPSAAEHVKPVAQRHGDSAFDIATVCRCEQYDIYERRMC